MLNQAKMLAEQGYAVTVLTFWGEGLPATERLGGIKVIRREFLSTREPYPLSKLSVEFGAILDQASPDIVHFHNGSYPAAAQDMTIGVDKILTMLKIIRARAIPIVEHSHNAQLKNPELTRPLRDFDWDCVICVSRFVKDRWLELGTGAKWLQVIYNGIDLGSYTNVPPAEEFIKLKEGSGKKIIFFPGRVISMTTGELSKQKNFSLVLDACCGLVKRGIKNFLLVAISNHSYANTAAQATLEMLRKRIHQNGLADYVVFIEPVDPQKMPSYYAGCDIVCVPSFNETFGLVYLEAMASGKVAIASNTGGPREYISNRENGFVVSPENCEELTAVLKKLINEEYDLNSLRQQALVSTKKFSIDKFIKKIRAVYKKVEEES